MLSSRIGLPVVLALAIAAPAAAEIKNIDRTLPLSANGTVELAAHNGRIEIRTWDRNEVEVHARIEWLGMSSSSWLFRETTVEVNGYADRVSIKWVTPDRYGWSLWSVLSGGWSGPDVRYTITAPKNARLDIRTHNAHTDIHDVNGGVRIATHNGMVRADNISGPFDLRMHNGWARVDYAAFNSDTHIAMHNGTAELALPAASKFDLDSRGHHARVDSDFQPAIHATVHGWGGGVVSGTVNGGGPGLRVVSHNGTVRLRRK